MTSHIHADKKAIFSLHLLVLLAHDVTHCVSLSATITATLPTRRQQQQLLQRQQRRLFCINFILL